MTHLSTYVDMTHLYTYFDMTHLFTYIDMTNLYTCIDMTHLNTYIDMTHKYVRRYHTISHVFSDASRNKTQYLHAIPAGSRMIVSS